MAVDTVTEKERAYFREQVYWIILGALIIGSFFIYIQWIFPGYWQLYHFKPGTVLIEPVLRHWPGIDYPHAWMFSYLGAGAITCICGLIEIRMIVNSDKSEKTTKGQILYALVRIALGIIFIALLTWYLAGIEAAYPTGDISITGGQDILFHNRIWERGLLSWEIINFVIGLSMVGLGIKMLRQGDKGPLKG